MKRLYSFLIGIVAIVAVLWLVSVQLENQTKGCWLH